MAIKQMVELGSEGDKDTLYAASEHYKKQRFRSPMDLEPANDPFIAFVPSCDIRFRTHTFLSVPYLIEVMVQMTVDSDAPPYFGAFSMVPK